MRTRSLSSMDSLNGLITVAGAPHDRGRTSGFSLNTSGALAESYYRNCHVISTSGAGGSTAAA